MADRTFSLSDIAFGESLIRVSAHLDNALDSYRRSDSSGALVHANRSFELMPQISRELWRYPELATALNQAAAGVASALRSRRPASEAAAACDGYDALSAQAVGAAVGEQASSVAYRASVVVALLRTATAAHEAGAHGDARAVAARARSLNATLWGGAISPDELEVAFEDLVSKLRAEAPGPAIRSTVGEIAGALERSCGAVLDLDPGPRDLLDDVVDLLEQAREAAAGGDAFRADKLLGRAYVEGYSGARAALETWEAEPELNELLGTRLRLAVAAGEPIDDLVDKARELLATAPL